MNDLAAWRVRGPVRTLRTELAEWDAIGGMWQPPRHITVASFHPDGRCAQSEFHNPDGSIVRTAYMYDSRGRLLETHSWKTGEPTTMTLYSHDESGRRVAVIEIAPDGSRREAEINRYDEAGRRIKTQFLRAHESGIAMCYAIEGAEQSYSAPGAVTCITTYDSSDLPAEATFRNVNGETVLRVALSRDAEGRLLEEVAQFAAERMFAASMPLDVTAGERAEFYASLSQSFPDETLSRTTFRYDEKGRRVERTRQMGGLSEERTTFEYDEHDNPIAEISEHHDREIGVDDGGAVVVSNEHSHAEQLRLDYQFDARGNWTERTVWHGIVPQPLLQRSNRERRTITYHEP